MRENRATVSEPSLTGQFAEGLMEGLRLTGYCMVILKIGATEKVLPAVKATEVHRAVADFTRTLRGEHFEAGVEIRIMAAEAPGPTKLVDIPELGDAIEDAEVVEE